VLELTAGGASVLIAFRFSFGVESKYIYRVTVMRSISKHVSWLCLLLTFWSVWAFTAHQHSNKADAAKCTVCIAVRSASPKTTSALPNATFVPVFTLRSQPVSTQQHLVAFALSVRPPPSV
jgi:hypothetical protein